MTQFELWLKACEEFHELLYRLSSNEEPETGLYKLTRQFEAGGNFYYETPVYVVWWRGKNVLTTENMRLAYQKWEGLSGE